MVIVARELLPEDADERARLLARYFQRQVVSTKPVADGWLLEIRWPASPQYYVDPQLVTGLNWWSSEMTVSAIPLAVRVQDGFQLSLNDSWSFFSWSCWLAERVQSGVVPPSLTVLHLDSHTDLMTPRLTMENDGLSDLLTSASFHPFDPQTVVSAIRSGSLGIGSFIAPLVHACPAVNLLHLCTAKHFRHEPGMYTLTPDLAQDDKLFPEARRPRVTLDKVSDTQRPAASSYFLSDDIHQLMQHAGSGPVFLHIDMDYFNNRFDGQPSWESLRDRYDCGEAELSESIDRVFEAIAATDLGDRIVDITVALSPGFFPAEYWGSAIAKVSQAISRRRLSPR